MAIGFPNAVVTTDGRILPFYRYEEDDEVFRDVRLEAWQVRTNVLNSRLIFDGMVAIEGCLDGICVLVCFEGSRAVDFLEGLGKLFLDSRPAGVGFFPWVGEEGTALTLTVFGIMEAEGPNGYPVPCLRAAAWSYAHKCAGLIGRHLVEGHLPAFPVAITTP